MPSILFVCTGNIFRSMTAEYALKAMLDSRSPIRVSSAGTVAIPQAMHPDVRAYLVQRGIDPSRHQQRMVSGELLHAMDLVIAMSTDHQGFLLNTFQYHAPLFNDVCHGRSEPLLDVWEGDSHLGNGSRCGSTLCVSGNGVYLGVYPMSVAESRDLLTVERAV